MSEHIYGDPRLSSKTICHEENKKGSHIAFNWKDFEVEESLGKVQIQAESFDPKNKKGTSLVLANLNHSEVWEGKNLEKFKTYRK